MLYLYFRILCRFDKDDKSANLCSLADPTIYTFCRNKTPSLFVFFIPRIFPAVALGVCPLGSLLEKELAINFRGPLAASSGYENFQGVLEYFIIFRHNMSQAYILFSLAQRNNWSFFQAPLFFMMENNIKKSRFG